jgi:hypothetical protein
MLGGVSRVGFRERGSSVDQWSLCGEVVFSGIYMGSAVAIVLHEGIVRSANSTGVWKESASHHVYPGSNCVTC